MFIAKLKFEHSNCWVTDLTTSFDCDVFSIKTDNIDKNYVSDLMQINCEPKLVENILSFLKAHKKVKEFQELGRDKDVLLVYVITKNDQSFIHKVVQNKCFQLDGIYFDNGFEVWRIGSTNKQNIKNFIEEMKELCSHVNLLSLREVENYKYQLLTQRQLEILKAARENGYYDKPRKNTLRALATKLNISKTSLGDTLQVIENKLIEEHIF